MRSVSTHLSGTLIVAQTATPQSLMKPLFTHVSFVSSVLLFASCSDREIVAYRIPKEPESKADAAIAQPSPATVARSEPAMAAGPSMTGTPVTAASGAALTWVAPAHWTVKPAGAMRKGSYSVSGTDGAVADLSVTAFPGDVGGESANVNRWRGQLQLAPLTDPELAGVINRLDEHGLKIAVVDLVNPASAKPTRLLGAMVPYDGATWFVKLLGPDTLVASEKPAFLEFLRSLQPAAKPVTP